MGQTPIHSLEIPLKGASLLLPSAAVAEVINPVPLSTIPGAVSWLLGVIGWRAHAVPVISFEALIGQTSAAIAAGSRIVVLYPIPGGRADGFFGFYAIAEPRPQSIIEGAVQIADESSLPTTPYIGGGIKMKDKTLLIPDFEELRKAFYP
jgi:chemosensory pili system protein ChpC